MKIYILILVITVFIDGSLFAQNKSGGKPIIDTNALNNGFRKWPAVGTFTITLDGHYLSFILLNRPVGRQTMVLQSTKGNWKLELPNAKRDLYLTDNSHQAVFINAGDSLCTIKLGSSVAIYTPNVQTFRAFKIGTSEKLLIQLKNPERALVLRDLATGKQQVFYDVVGYELSNNGKTLLLQRELDKDRSSKQTLAWITLVNGTEKKIWEGAKANSVKLDGAGKQLAFVVNETTSNKIAQTFWYYKEDMTKAEVLVTNQSAGLGKGYTLNGIDRFSTDGSQLFFKIKEPDFAIPKSDAVKVDVWSYSDVEVPFDYHGLAPSVVIPSQLNSQSFQAVIDIDNHAIIRLQQENESIDIVSGKGEEIAFVQYSKHEQPQTVPWIAEAKPTNYIVSIRTGARKELPLKLIGSRRISVLSPNGRYLILTDNEGKDVYSYDMQTKETKNLTAILPMPLDYDGKDIGDLGQNRFLTVGGWFANSGDFLLYDQYDIWRLDPSGTKSGVCLTKSYGRNNHIMFKLLEDFEHKLVSEKDILPLSAFNTRNKDNGFYMLDLARTISPEKLFMGPYSFYAPGTGVYGTPPVKAGNASAWVVARESCQESLNLFFTTDLRHFKLLTNNYPERAYNWMTSELKNFKTLDGKDELGVLYKPENFDSTKKYPAIIHYYEKKSDELNKFRYLGDIVDAINIPWFVSHGYLVFTPDIHYTKGDVGQDAVNSVAGAAKFLAEFSWVDAKHIGIQGHSWGGYETNFIVTHTNIFAAAMSSSGFSDQISQNLESGFGAEQSQSRQPASLWARPDLYIKNSPVFFADKVETPLLMMNNKQDHAVHFEQGVEFFTALRRLGKKVWLLQYDGETHSLTEGKISLQHTIRVTQFFDHYLKGAPAPKWMVKGIPAKMKGIDDGLELEPPGVVPGPGILTPEEQKKVDSLKYRQPITIKL